MNALFPHAARTGDVVVRVAVSFLPEQSELSKERWFWAYHIRIENSGDAPVQLLTRHWVITDARGYKQDVEGEGVVGEQPMIAPGESFDYVSGCPLATPTGTMEGSYRMLRADGSHFDAEIPCFPLVGPAVTG
ncbi:Co2+/Mg2+ efflux protein ApaG [Parasphingopyxis marina]|uniref:Protein ApaG n=1 Tax=Parasphingopyxis marina TaxID=2761622 RepID=A0A842HTZ5_9SPHN|nr:Co2+/Mg2+ efflux protein ApaG [Parasphingopyxis marina]MBC2777418.1 Co2+/Mg2+ efflux protein ApaG [Parasphingopyxis marina]